MRSMSNYYNVFTDGGARGNPGPGAAAYVIEICQDKKCQVIEEKHKYLGAVTNNQAEYQALILAIESVIKKDRSDQIIFHLDSQLIVEQMNGRYKVKNNALILMYTKAKELVSKTQRKITFIYIPREQNKRADKLVNQALDEGIGAALE